MNPDVRYWLQGEGVQNFGDFLSEYLLQNLFYPQPSLGREIRIIGSCIDDGFMDSPPRSRDGGDLDGHGPIFWGCGLRREDGLSAERRRGAEILSVRGPLTHAALRLTPTVPIGDPALLLPALYSPAGQRDPNRPTLIVPHFHDKRNDGELLSLTGCAAVLRPNIPNDLASIGEFIDQIVAADFVLCGAMHAAIVAAAYDRPFAFWDSGEVDLPFKWRDFAASVGIPCVFHSELTAAEAHYRAAIAPAIRIPVLWPVLVASPLPVRPNAFVSVIKKDIARHGVAILDATLSLRPVNRLRDRLAKMMEAASVRAQLEANEVALRERIAVLTEREEQRRLEDTERLEAQLVATEQREAKWQAEYEHLRSAQAETRVQMAALQGDLIRLRGREATLAAEEARLHVAVQDRDHALAAVRTDLAARATQIDAMLGSKTWRFAASLRAAGQRLPWVSRVVRRLAYLVWWTVTLQLGRHLKRRRRLRGPVLMLQASPLFDPGFYLAQNPDVAAAHGDPVAHYVFTGAALGYDPCRLFDGKWYTQTYPDCAASGLSPLAHYVSEGAARGHDPHPLFDTAWYAARHPEAGSGIAALLHYLSEGAAAGAAPNRLFDPAGYLAEYPDARESGLDPLQHFIQLGVARNRHPHALFDTGWYTATYPEVAASGMDPLSHYLRIGAAKDYHCTPLQRHIVGFRLDQDLAFAERDNPEASLVIPVYGHPFDTLRCLHSLAAHSPGVGFEVIVLDDNPANPVAPFLARIPGLRVHANRANLGFVRSCNQASALARGWHIVFLNNDTLVEPDWLEPLLRPVRHDPKVGLVGCKLLNTDGTLQEAGGIMFRNGWGYSFGRGDDPSKPEYNYYREVDVVTGAAFLVRRELFQQLGGFDERYAPAFYEEFDLAFKARRAGFKVMYQPRSVVTHFGSASYGADARDRQSQRNHAAFCVQWRTELESQFIDDGDLFRARQRPNTAGLILVIDDKVPEYDRHAGALTIFQYIKLLKSLGFRLVYYPDDLTPRQPYTSVLQEMGVEVLYAPSNLPIWLAANGRHLSAVWMARPDVSIRLLDLVRATTAARILYYPHDLHYLREMRRYELEGDVSALEESNRVRKIELAIFREVDCVMTPSSEEAKVIRREVPSANVRVIPPYLYPPQAATGLDESSFTARHDVLFVGGFKHPPNVDAALWLTREIMPLVWHDAPDARLILVGDDPTEEVQALSADDRVDVTGYVPELGPYFERACVSLNPLRYGAGVKGKIVGSLQAGIPVVTTAVGNEGIALVDGREVLLGETPAELAVAVVGLLRDPALCASLSAAGIMVINERFSETMAREVMQSVLQMDLCLVCGNIALGSSAVVASDGGTTAGQRACDQCGAGHQDKVLAGALLTLLRDVIDGHGANSLRDALPVLSRLRIHAFGCAGSAMEQLRDSTRFTCSSAPGAPEIGAPWVTSAPLLRDGELDLLISQDAGGLQFANEDCFREARRVLKPGGHYIVPMPNTALRDKVDPVAALREAGFDIMMPPDVLADDGAATRAEMDGGLIVLAATRI